MLFHKEDMFFNVDAENREDLIKKMSKIFLERGYIKNEYCESLIKREEEYPTGLTFNNYNVAIPHTTYSLINEQRIAFVRLNDYVEFGEMGTNDKQLKVKVVLFLLIMKGEEQVTVLQNLMNVFKDSGCYEILENSENIDEVYNILVNRYGEKEE